MGLTGFKSPKTKEKPQGEKMGLRQNKNKVYGSQIFTILPVISTTSTHIEDFSEYRADLPFNLMSFTNNSNSYLDIYYDNKYLRVFANETKVIDNTSFRHLRIITNSVAITSGDVVINVQSEGINADLKARQDYLSEQNPISRIVGVLGRLL